jgi:hypothetical protein
VLERTKGLKKHLARDFITITTIPYFWLSWSSSAIIFLEKDQFNGCKRTTKDNHASPEPLPSSIPNFLKSVNSGTITIHIENEPVLRLTITQSDTDRIKLEFGQRLAKKALVIGLNRLFHTD